MKHWTDGLQDESRTGRKTDGETFTRCGGVVSRVLVEKQSPNVYPTGLADRRRLNSVVNAKHVRNGWQEGKHR